MYIYFFYSIITNACIQCTVRYVYVFDFYRDQVAVIFQIEPGSDVAVEALHEFVVTRHVGCQDELNDRLQ